MKGLLGVFAKRYIAGTGISDAIDTARALNRIGIEAEIDNLGENVNDEREAKASADEYLTLIDEIRASGIRSTVSLKLTHMGLDLSDKIAEENAGAVMEKALSLGNFVWLDMEGSAYTQRTLDIFLKLRSRYADTGIAVQSCLRRSAADVRLLIEKNARVRLVKGAYREPPEVAFPDKKDVDENYEALMKELLLRGNRPAIATHDERLIKEAIRFAGEKGVQKGSFEFQMLLGIKRTLQRRLAGEGFNVTVYVPYGKDWLPYTMRRLKERRENIYFVLRNLFD